MDLREKPHNKNRHPWELSRAKKYTKYSEKSIPECYKAF